MSDSRAIGVFDSGIGGLTVLHALWNALPRERTIYVGDVARCPYGPRPQDEVRGFAHEIARYLIETHDIKVLVVACNTASAAALESLRTAYNSIPVIGVIEPGARAAVEASGSRRIGVIATPGTVASGAYTRAVHAVAPDAHVVAEACPRLVPLVEAGETHGSHARLLLRDYLAPLETERIDTLILGCTHYPLLRPTLDEVVERRITIVDSAGTTAAETATTLDRLDMHGAPYARNGTPQHRVYTTGEPAEFRRLAARLFGGDVGPVEQTDLRTRRVAVAPYGLERGLFGE